jgi:hypothetical protein
MQHSAVSCVTRLAFKVSARARLLTPPPALRSFLEIYNELITDLLRPASSGLNIRDGDIKRGVYVEDLSETNVLNGGLRVQCGVHAPA